MNIEQELVSFKEKYMFFIKSQNELINFDMLLARINEINEGNTHCPDQLIDCDISSLDEENFYNKRKIIDYTKIDEFLKNKNKFFLLVLESPHKDEFKGNKGPAKGKTGKFIYKNFNTIFGDYYNEYTLIVVNSVQYQCSLGFNLKSRIKDKILKEIFIKDKIFKKSFYDRIKEYKKYFLAQKYMISLVIAICSGEIIKDTVENIIYKVFPKNKFDNLSVKIIERHHPSYIIRKQKDKEYLSCLSEKIKKENI